MKKNHYFLQILFVCFAACGIAVSSCSKKTETETQTAQNAEQTDVKTKQAEEKPVSGETVVVALQPFSDYSQAETKKMADELKKHWKELPIEGNWEFRVLSPITPGTELLNEAKARLDAAKILNRFSETANDHYVTIGLTHKDISHKASDRPGGDGPNGWGVFGLSYMNKHVSVVSDYREKVKSQFWKTATHEFLHAHFGLPHCPGNDLKCIMKDAEGKPKTHLQTNICDICRAKMKK